MWWVLPLVLWFSRRFGTLRGDVSLRTYWADFDEMEAGVTCSSCSVGLGGGVVRFWDAGSVFK